MTGILNVLLGSSGASTSTFNITAGIVASGAGYSDGSAGTDNGIASGSISSASLGGGKAICEIAAGITSDDRIYVKGFSADPGQNWLVKAVINGATRAGASVTTYTWDSAHGTAKWKWTTNTFGLVNGNTYNGNTITHGP